MVISRSTRSHVRVSIGSPSVQSEKPLRTCCHNSFNIWGLKCVRCGPGGGRGLVAAPALESRQGASERVGRGAVAPAAPPGNSAKSGGLAGSRGKDRQPRALQGGHV